MEQPKTKYCKYCMTPDVWWDEAHECSSKPVAVSEIINNQDHPIHTELKQLFEDIKSGKVQIS